MKLFRIVATYFFIVGAYAVSAQSIWSPLGPDIEGGAGDGLGSTLSMSADGTIVAAGAPGADAGGSGGSLRGLVKVYVLESGSWTQMGSTINGTEDGAGFGAAISISDDGTLLAIGAPHSASTFGAFSNSGRVKIYTWDADLSEWNLEETIEAEAAGDNFGYAVSISGDGSVIAVGAPVNAAGGDSRGTVRVYEWDGSLLTSREDLDGAADFDGFGTAVSLNLDGSVLAIGSPSKSGSGGELNVGQVTTYSWNTTTYSNTGTLDGVAEYDTFGDEVSLSDDGTRLAVSVTKFFGGVTYVELFDFSTSWSSIGTINSANDSDGFGNSISLSGDGSHVVIGASSNVTGSVGGRAEVYAYSGAAWEKVDTNLLGDAENDGAGTAVAISADGAFVAVGAPTNVAGGINAGQVKVYELAVPDLDAPTVAITSEEGNDTKNSPFAITITFSEEVTGFVAGDIDVTNGAAGNFATSDNITFTADITPGADGTVTVNIGADVAQDLGGNANLAATEFSIVYDATAPTVAIDAITTNNQTPALTGTIDDNTATISVTVGEETNEATNNGDGTWTLPDNTLSSLPEAEYTVSAVATDALGNQSDEVTALLTIDLTGPQIFFDNGNLTGLASFTDPVSISPLIVNIFFTEEATGLTLGEITIDGNVGTTGLSEADESGTSYYILAVPLQNPNIDQQITITIPAGAAEDAAGNPNAEGTVTISYDITGPSVSDISTVGQNTTNASPIAVQIEFSEEITELTADDFTVDNGTIAATPSSEDNITFTLEISPANEGLVTIQLLADAVEDFAGNTNASGSDVVEITYDITVPDVEITTESESTANSPIVATVTFTEAVDQLTADDFTITNGTATGVSTGDAETYTLEVTPDAPAEGSTSTSGVAVTIALEAGKAQDAAGNSNTASNNLTVSFDDQAPKVYLYSDAGLSLAAVSGGFTANFIFTEPILGFDINDIIVTNGTKSNFREESILGSTRYRVDIALAGTEDVTLTIPVDAVTDGAGNENAETVFTVLVDNTGPTVTISSSASSPTKVNPIPVTFTFSEAVTGFTKDDVAIDNFSVTSEPSSDDNITFVTTIAPTANGELTIALKDASVTDVAGNPLTNTGVFTITYDNVAPTLTIDGPNAVNTTDPFTLTLNFSEPISGLTADNFTIAGAALGTVTATSTSIYTVPLTPQQAGSISVTVKGFADLAGNTNTDGATKSILFDNTRPTVIISGTPVAPVDSKNPINFTFTFSELVTGFTIEDVIVANAIKANFTGSGKVYTADISPNEIGEVTVTLAENVAQDAAGNGNEAASVAFTYAQKYNGGSGTEADPYLIATKSNLKQLSQSRVDWSAHFKQTENITFVAGDFLVGGDFYNNGLGFSPVGNYSYKFTGSYDGDDHTIANLTITRKTQNDIGMFGNVGSGAIIKDLGLIGLEITGKDFVGGLIGSNLGSVTNSYASGSVSALSSSVGGLIGYNIGGIVMNSYASGSVSGPDSVGGLIGAHEGGSVSSSFSSGSVTGTSAVGGLIGSNRATVTNSYSFESVSGARWFGGLIGAMNAGSVSNSFASGSVSGFGADGLIGIALGGAVTNSFWDKELSAIETSDGGTGLTTAEMYVRQTYVNAGWDLENIWSHVFGYPTLKWQAERHNKPFKVSGRVLDENGNAFTAGRVQALRLFPSANYVSTDLDATGQFSLNLLEGSYTLSVAPTNPSAYDVTYLGNTNRSDRARPVFYDNIYTIKMIARSQVNLLDGNGRVSGKVVKSAGGARIVQGRVLEGDPLEGVAVMLIRTSDEQVMTTVETDANGDFEITGIPAGEYQLVLGVAGLDLNLEGSTFTMDEAGTPLVISAAVGEDGITFAIEEVLGVEDEIALSIYPNPAENQVNVLGKGQLTVRLLSLSGNTLVEKQFVDQTAVDLSLIPHGVYLLEIVNDSQQRTVKRLLKSN